MFVACLSLLFAR